MFSTWVMQSVLLDVEHASGRLGQLGRYFQGVGGVIGPFIGMCGGFTLQVLDPDHLTGLSLAAFFFSTIRSLMIW